MYMDGGPRGANLICGVSLDGFALNQTFMGGSAAPHLIF